MATFDALIEAQLSGASIKASPLVLFDFESGPMRAWSGFTPLVAGGETWTGVPGFSLSTISSGSDLSVGEVECQLFGSPSLLDHFHEDAEVTVGRDMTVALQFFDVRQTDEAGAWVEGLPVDEPLALFAGTTSPLLVSRPVSDGPATRTLKVRAVDKRENRARPDFGRFSHQDQQARSPGDNFFVRVADETARWPDFTV